MVHFVLDFFSPPPSDSMGEALSSGLISLPGMSGTLQEIAFKIADDQQKTNQKVDNVTRERTIFVLGSKGVVRLSASRDCGAIEAGSILRARRR